MTERDESSQKQNMDNYQKKERKIRIIDCIWRAVSQWRIMIISALLFAILLGGLRYYKDSKAVAQQNSATAPTSATTEEIKEKVQELAATERTDVQMAIRYIDLLKEKETYIDQSAVMQLDACKVPRMVLQYHVQADKNTSEILQAYSEALYQESAVQEIVAASNGTYKDSDVTDMVVSRNGGAGYQTDNRSGITTPAATVGEENSVLYLTVRGSDKDSVQSVANVVKSILQDANSDIAAKYGAHSVELITENYKESREADVVSLQNTNYDYISTINDRITKLTDGMTDVQKALVNEYKVSKSDEVTESKETSLKDTTVTSAKASVNKKWILLGFVFGAFIIFAWEVILWMFGGKLNSAEELQQNFEVKMLGVLSQNKKKKGFAFIDKLLYQIKNKNKKILTDEQSLKMIASEIELSAKQKGVSTVYLTGTEIDHLSRPDLTAELQKILETGGIKLVQGEVISIDPNALKEITEIGAAVLIEEVDQSKYAEIERELQLCRDQSIDLLGTVVVGE